MLFELFTTIVLQNPPLPSDLKGRNFVKVLGTHTRYLPENWVHRFALLFSKCGPAHLIMEFVGFELGRHF
jgi:hypothetical protein